MPQTKKEGMEGTKAIRRAIDILRAVAQFQRTGASLSRIAQATDLNNSTTFRMLRSLSEERLLRYDKQSRSYYVGPLAFELGLAASLDAHIQSEWHEAIDEVARRTRFTTYLMARSDREAVCLLCIHGLSHIRAIPMETGQRLPLGIGAGSLAILATLNDDEIQHIVDSHESYLELYPGGKLEHERILERVKQTKKRGFSISGGTVATGVSGIGVAVLPRKGLTQLAISVSAVTDSFDSREAKNIYSIISDVIQKHHEVDQRKLKTAWYGL